MDTIKVATFDGPGSRPMIRSVARPKVPAKAALIRIGACGVCANDLPNSVDMLHQARDRYPWYAMQTLHAFDEAGVASAIDDAMAMRTVKSTILPNPDLAEA